MKTIMVVDDEERIRRILGQMLAGRGFNVVKANNALEAHRLIAEENQSVDLMLLDINMPAVQGDIFYEVVQSFHYKTKVIVCSVLPVEEQTRRVPEATDYYDKADSFNVLMRKIEAALQGEMAKKKILIIDDDSHLRLSYRRLLMEEGYFPIDTGDRPEIFDFLEGQIDKIDLILLDVAVPTISCMKFFALIRRKYPHAKVIVSSRFPQDLERPFVFKAQDYYDKSSGTDVLLEKIRRLIAVEKEVRP